MGISIVIDENGVRMVDDSGQYERVSRPQRGHSILKPCADYVAVYLETTGLDPKYCEIIEIGAVRVRDGHPCETYQSFVQPTCLDDVDEYITNLTGITPAMLADAPKIADVLPAALAFIGNDVIVGHNASFDVNFLYDASAALQLGPVCNDYIDTMRLSRRLFPKMVNHKLRTLIREFGIAQTAEHRAAEDAQMASQCYKYMIDYASKNSMLDDLSRSYGHKRVRAADITARDGTGEAVGPLAGQMVIFTGALERMTRKEAMQVVADLGGINGDTVTKHTNYLVLGNNDFCKSIKDGKSSKQKKAEKYILDGADLQIISETVFYDMIASEFPAAPADAAPVSDCSAFDLDNLTPYEAAALHAIYSACGDLANHFHLERRSNDYLTIVAGKNYDFCRVKATARALWLSLDVAADDRQRDDSRFACINNSGVRHWKFPLSSVADVAAYADLILHSASAALAATV